MCRYLYKSYEGFVEKRGICVRDYKAQLVRRLHDEVRCPSYELKNDILKKILRNWFLSPLQSRELSLGRANEELAAQGLEHFLKAHAPPLTVSSIHFRGLTC